MKIMFFISILGLLTNCNQDSDIYTTLFKIPERERFAVVNIDSFNNLSDLSNYMCSENRKHIFLFDFKKNRFNKKAKTGIELLIDKSLCGYDVHIPSQTVFAMDSLKNWNYEGKRFKKERLAELVKLNFLNNGFNPILSESPQKTVFTIRCIREEKIESLEGILSDLADAYIEFVTQYCSNKMDLSKCKKLYPLNIIISYKQNISLKPVVNEEKIIENIDLDLGQ